MTGEAVDLVEAVRPEAELRVCAGTFVSPAATEGETVRKTLPVGEG